MMDSGPARNMQSTLTNKFEKLCILLVFYYKSEKTRFFVLADKSRQKLR